ncbi:hypothetical protein MWH28_12645 [Natroniella sulfidigena]|uniref:hypothetical protein n=1 Tax=Natroniella sulfidigena TaxID=723921 RepID=UPI00200AE19A|nr:hypothetical protein [Natroniella sulfidigena]MCK8818206.1 hypothetical protein [Natroniella sulfidigena]
MGFFGSKNKKEKQNKKVKKFMNKYKLNNIDKEDLEILEEISNDLTGLGLMKAGMTLSFSSADKQATVGYLSALVKQNWVIIRKLDEINKSLDKLEKD